MFTLFDHKSFFTAVLHRRHTFSTLCRCENMSYKRRSEGEKQHVYRRLTTHANKIAYSVEGSSEDRRDLAHNCETFLEQDRYQVHGHALFVQFLTFSLLRRYAGDQIWHNSSLTGCFFPPRIRWFLYQCESDPLRTSVCLWSCSRSTSAFGKIRLLSRRTWKACCPLQRYTALVVCSSLKEPMFMFGIMAQQEVVWCPYSAMKINHVEVWLDGSKC